VTARWIFRRARREVWRRPGPFAAVATATALAVLLAGAGLLGARAARSLQPRLAQDVHVIAYLDDDLGPLERQRLLVALRLVPGVARARAVEPAEALERLRAAASSLGGPAALGPLDVGFLPRSVEIAMAADAPDLGGRTRALANRLRRLPGVAEVDGMGDGLGRLQSWLAAGERLGQAALAVALLAGAGALALALLGGRVRRRQEREILQLLGQGALASGFTAGIVSAGAALAGSALGLLVLRVIVPRAVGALEQAVGLGALARPSLSAGEVALTLAVALLLGALTGGLGLPGRQSPPA
jgi:cell division transport system permease protein